MNLKKAYNLVLILTVALALSMVGGTLAFAAQEITAVNEYRPGLYSTELEEVFTSPSSWLPGEEVNKDVTVVNKGEVPVFTKVVVNQKWVRQENVYDSDGKPVAPLKGESFPLTFTPVRKTASLRTLPVASKEYEYAAIVEWGPEVVLYDGTNAATSAGKWLLMSEEPDADGNQTLYYMGVLDANATSPLIVDSVQMNPLIEALTVETNTYYDKEKNQWVTKTKESPTYDYQNALYTMTVTMYTVQATAPALTEMFRSDIVSEQAVISHMEKLAISPADKSRDDSVEQKLLYITEQDGKLSYTPATGTENWFMSHLNLIPGASYTDTLEIENRASETAELYMQVILRDQEEMPDKLLDYIYMKVFQGDKLIYEGTAKGGSVEGGSGNLQEAILLGKYEKGAKDTLRVELSVDKDLPIEFSGVLSKIDWKFMLKGDETPTPTPKNKGSFPKTGDLFDRSGYMLFMSVSGAMLVFCIAYLVRTKKKMQAQRAAAIITRDL